MSDPTESGIARFAPYLLLVGLATLTVRAGLQPVTNADTLFHLRFGHEFLGPWSLREPGSVSSLATAPWTPTQWLPQVVMARAEDWFGLGGVAWLTAAQITGFVLAVLVACRHRSSLLVATTVTLVTVVVAGGGLSGRPQVISYLLTAVTVDAWLRTREDQRVRWWLVPLTWVWAQCHGMWPLALVIGAVAIVGGLLDRTSSLRSAGREALVVGGSLVVAGLTPVGPALYRAIFAVGARAEYIPEWGAPDFTSPSQLVLAAMIAGYLLLRLRGGPVAWTEVLFVLLGCGWSVYSARTAPIAAIVMAPLLAGALQSVLPPRAPVRARERAVVLGGALAALAVVAVVLPARSVSPDPYPAVDQALAALPDRTVVLNEWTDGGYLMWRHPDLDVGMHGYLDTYTIEEIGSWRRLLAARPGWQDLLARTHARYAVLAPDTPLTAALTGELGWSVVESSDGRQVLRAPEEG